MSVRILVGDCRKRLSELADQSAHCCVTSPPYFGLRDYGVDGQIGLESAPDLFIAEIVNVFREVRRVLRDDGTLWLNLGDSYCNTDKWGGGGNIGKNTVAPDGSVPAWAGRAKRDKYEGAKPKDLLMIPARAAIALQADGWYLRSHIIWHKPNPMPESVTDRPTSSHESLFLLAKSERYFYDADAIREPCNVDDWDNGMRVFGGVNKAGANAKHGDRTTGRVATARNNFRRENSKRAAPHVGQTMGTHRPDRPDTIENPNGRNKRNVWTVATRPFSEAHFATFPPELIEPCIKAGCPNGGTVLDPFGGAGTTGLVADRLGRSAVLCELNPEYAEIAERRIRTEAGMFARVEVAA